MNEGNIPCTVLSIHLWLYSGVTEWYSERVFGSVQTAACRDVNNLTTAKFYFDLPPT